MRANHTYLSLADDVVVDVHEAARWARRITGHEAVVDDAQPIHVLAGRLLPDWDDEWLIVERERLHLLFLTALEELCAGYLRSRRPHLAIEAAVQAVSLEPLRETSYRYLIEAFVESGNPAQALQHYMRFQANLAEQLQIAPTRGLIDRIKEIRSEVARMSELADFCRTQPTSPGSDSRIVAFNAPLRVSGGGDNRYDG